MNNAELIKRLRDVPCWDIGTDVEETMLDAADALEADKKKIADYTAAVEALDDSNDAYIKENERLKKRIAELERQHGEQLTRNVMLVARLPKWTMLKDEMPKPHTNVLVSGIEAINNSRVYKVMVNDNGTLRPTDYAPSIRWDYWMPFESPNCGAKMKGEQE